MRLTALLLVLTCGVALAAPGTSTTVVVGDGSCDPVAAGLTRATRPDPAVSRRLADLFSADQRAREAPTPNWTAISAQDRVRRQVAERLIRAGKLSSAADFYRAAMLFQHGNCPAQYERAQKLAWQAVQLGSRPARWLYAAATDRLLRMQGKPQRFGTQYRCQDGIGALEPYDQGTTNAERARFDVPPLAEALSRARTICR